METLETIQAKLCALQHRNEYCNTSQGDSKRFATASSQQLLYKWEKRGGGGGRRSEMLHVGKKSKLGSNNRCSMIPSLFRAPS